MKNLFIFMTIFVLIPALIVAQDADYKVPAKLGVEDFQMPDDKAFLKKFDEAKIPLIQWNEST